MIQQAAATHFLFDYEFVKQFTSMLAAGHYFMSLIMDGGIQWKCHMIQNEWGSGRF